jgi:CBS domain containing-hemolysin-like protein
MQQGGHRHLPVVDEDDRPLGIVSVKRIIHYLVEHYPAAVYNLPPEHAVISHEREGA